MQPQVLVVHCFQWPAPAVHPLAVIVEIPEGDPYGAESPGLVVVAVVLVVIRNLLRMPSQRSCPKAEGLRE